MIFLLRMLEEQVLSFKLQLSQKHDLSRETSEHNDMR